MLKTQDVIFINNKNNWLTVIPHKDIVLKNINTYFKPALYQNKLYFNIIINTLFLNKILKYEKKILSDLY